MSLSFTEIIAKLPKEFRKPFKRYQQIINGGQKPTDEDVCLPIRIGEGFEVLAIQFRNFDFTLHGPIGNLMHFLVTVFHDFPFHTYEACANDRQD